MDDEEINFTNGADILNMFLQMEQKIHDQLENLIREEMVDVHVDTNGTFYYKPTDKYINLIKTKQENELKVINTPLSFTQILRYHQKYNDQ